MRFASTAPVAEEERVRPIGVASPFTLDLDAATRCTYSEPTSAMKLTYSAAA